MLGGLTESSKYLQSPLRIYLTKNYKCFKSQTKPKRGCTFFSLKPKKEWIKCKLSPPYCNVNSKINLFNLRLFSLKYTYVFASFNVCFNLKFIQKYIPPSPNPLWDLTNICFNSWVWNKRVAVVRISKRFIRSLNCSVCCE